VGKVKCPGCSHRFEIVLTGNAESNKEQTVTGVPLILIVDDARFFRQMIEDLLSDLPVEFISAADGDEAWVKITTRLPQLVLLDLNIPGRSGKQILQSIQEEPRLNRIKVLAMSGVERGEETAAAVRRFGAVDFINKSFKPSELEKRVRNILAI
jgi:DNA-binding response OmpR family regulator